MAARENIDCILKRFGAPNLRGFSEQRDLARQIFLCNRTILVPSWTAPHPHSSHWSQECLQARLDEIPVKPNRPTIIIHLVYFDFSSPLLSAPIYPIDDDNTHLLTLFEGDYWYIFKVFYLLKLAYLTSVVAASRRFHNHNSNPIPEVVNWPGVSYSYSLKPSKNL